MGTRSLTHIHSETGSVLVTLYRQFDGYPTGHGQEMASFLASGQLVNGIQLGKRKPEEARRFNGMGDLAVQLITYLKQLSNNGILHNKRKPAAAPMASGNLYIYPRGIRDCGEDYTYHIREEKGAIILQCISSLDQVLYEGDVGTFDGKKAEAAIEES